MAFVARDYMESRGAGAGFLPDTLPVLPERIGAQSQSWRWTQTTGDSTRIEVSAEDFVQGADGVQTDLRGVVLKIFRGGSDTHDRVESAAMRLADGGDLYSEGETVFTLGISEGDPDRPVVASTSGVTFRPAANSARTDRLVRYEFEGGRGRSAGAEYQAGSGTLRMLADVWIETAGDGDVRSRTTIRAGGLLYREARGRIDLTGGASVRQGPRWMDCARGTLWLAGGRLSRLDADAANGGEASAGGESRFATPEMRADFGQAGELLQLRGRGETRFVASGPGSGVSVRGRSVDLLYDPGPVAGRSFLKRVEAGGDARARMDLLPDGSRNTIRSEELLLEMRAASSEVERVQTLRRGRLEQVSPDPRAASRTLEADRISLRYGGGNRVEALDAAGDARMFQAAGEAGGPGLRTWSESLTAAFDPATAAISGIRQEGGFRFEERRPDGGEARRGESEEARFELEGGALTLVGAASVSDGGSVVSASRIELDRESGRLEARGGVTVSVAPGGDGAGLPSGLFGSQQAVFAAADSLVAAPGGSALEYRGEARLWQGRNRIDADAIVLDRAAAALRAEGAVSARWSDSADSGGSVSVLAARMAYDEGTGEAWFRESVDFRRSGFRALCEQLRAALGEAGESPSGTAVASGSVRIAEFADGTGIRGFADTAEFLPADSEVRLAGRPARLLSPDGTETRGARLTFRMDGDSLLARGGGAQRAYTYSPASR